MLDRRDALRLLASSALGMASSFGESTAQTPGKAHRKGARAGLARIEEIVEEILQEFEIVGASLAMAKDGRLVLARGFGLADAEGKKPVTPETLFSLGSVTKPISSVAVLKLVDLGKIRLDARLVDVFADLKPNQGSRPADPRFPEITIHQILYHGSGLGHDAPPTGTEPKARARKNADDDGNDDEVAPDRLIDLYRLAMSRPLDFAPGTDHRYSNVGFALLQLLIPHVTGEPYEKWVQEHVLRPMGITKMVMETDSFVPGETRRYARGPNGVRSVSLHKASNWLGTPTDLVKFLTVVSGSRGKPILSERLHQMMLAVPPQLHPGKDGRHVGLGWDTVQSTPGGVRYSKNGGKLGVRAWLEHLPNGVDWAFQFNTTDLPALPPKVPGALNEANRRIAEVALEMKRWPEIDLFKSG